ncbi:DsbA family oxidoreductase [Alteripontixanthobacter maritimus]|uniref:DsbA family oxidoreductase n=1 Tax=Alteripontixanthobacter maritimus TaxID=2161824 RepID=UPI002DD90543|nr:DsbA family oxidoreductase [Alteripontixanthobacter maritimus]
MSGPAPTEMRIDIWSDVMCPWCIIGWKRLEQALATLDGEIAAEVRWLPFELNPDMAAQGEERTSHLARKYGRTPEDAAKMGAHMSRQAADAGFSFDYAGEGEAPPAMMWNTFEAHKLLRWTLAEHGSDAQMRLKLALFTAHFQHRRRIGERDVLLDIAEEEGLDRDAAAAALDDETVAHIVRMEERQAMDNNITGVPAVVVDGKFLIPGAQEPDVYVNALRRIASKVKT